MKKGDAVAVDDDDDAVRSSVSQERVTVTLFTGEFFQKCVGGEEMDSLYDT